MNIQTMIYGLTKLYSEVKYNFGIFARRNIDLDKEYKKSLNEVMNCKSLFQYSKILKKFITLLNDPHSYVNSDSVIRSENIGILPIILEMINDEWYVTGFSKKYEGKLTIMSKLVKVNGLCTDEYFTKFIYPYACHAPHKGTLAVSNEFILGETGEEVSLELSNLDGSISAVSIIREEMSDSEYVYKSITPFFSDKVTSLFKSNENYYEILESDDIGILSLKSFAVDGAMDDLIKNVHLIKSKKKIIIDLRYNSGGSSLEGDKILSLFTNKKGYKNRSGNRVHKAYDKARAYFKISWEELATFDDYKAKYKDEAKSEFKDYYLNYYDCYKDTLVEEEKLYDEYRGLLSAEIVVLVSKRTASAAEAFLQGFKELELGVIIGSRTAGAGGQPLMVELPYGMVAGICTGDNIKYNGKPLTDYGFEPDIQIEYRLEDLLSDTIIDKHFEEARKYFSKKS